MRTLARLLAVLSLAAASPAGAIDLTGTWVATHGGSARCRHFVGSWQSYQDGVLGTLYITQVGFDLHVEIARGGYPEFQNTFKGVVAPSADPVKSVASATACKIDGEYYHGAFLVSKAKADATGGVMTIEYLGTNISAPERCKAKLVRTDPADPAVAQTCP